MSRGPLFYYAAWPLGYHNVVPRRKAAAFAAAGWDVAYVTGIGFRNPRLRSLVKAADRLSRAAGRAPAADAPPPGVRPAGVIVAPPRQLAPVRLANAAWLGRQLRGIADPWAQAVAWVRYPTPELVDVLEARRPKVVVYECADAYEFTPGSTGAWRDRLVDADHRLGRLADAVVVVSETLAERFRELGARRVEHIPPGVDLPDPAVRSDGRPGEPVTAGFVGTLDYRLDVPALRALAQARPDWRLRLIGPAQEGFGAELFADLPNVAVEPSIPNTELLATLATFDLGLMPYVDDQLSYYMAPVKNLEFLSVGVPAVGRPVPALRPFAGVVRFAETPEEFVREAVAAVEEDSPERVEHRIRVAAENTWERRLGEHVALLDELAG